jgi:hypothetical protein
MIILDEQLLSYGIRDPMARWYRGQVVAITQLRPQTVMRDDAIPMLLRAARRPTFVTINVGDFWRRLPPDPHFCLGCCAVAPPQALEVPTLVRRLFQVAPFRTQRQRLGTIIRVSPRPIQYDTTMPPVIQRCPWPRVR